MRLALRFFALPAVVLSCSAANADSKAPVSCNLVPLAGTGESSLPVAQPLFGIKPLPTPQLYQFDCSDDPRGKPQSGVTPTIPVFEGRKK